MYSGCVNDFIIKWLTLKGQDNNYFREKSQFLQKLIKLINGEEM